MRHVPACPSLTPSLNPMAVMTDNGLDRPDLINLERHNMSQILANCGTTSYFLLDYRDYRDYQPPQQIQIMTSL